MNAVRLDRACAELARYATDNRPRLSKIRVRPADGFAEAVDGHRLLRVDLEPTAPDAPTALGPEAFELEASVVGDLFRQAGVLEHVAIAKTDSGKLELRSGR